MWVVPLKDKKGNTIINDSQKIFNEPSRKPNKTWVEKGSVFYKISMKQWLQLIEMIFQNYYNDLEIYPTHNKGN